MRRIWGCGGRRAGGGTGPRATGGFREVAGHEQALVGQYGLFLTEAARNLPPQQRPLLANGRVLGLYPGVPLADQATRQRWERDHPNHPEYSVKVPGARKMGEMAAEGFGGAVAFANTRVLPPRPGRVVV